MPSGNKSSLSQTNLGSQLQIKSKTLSPMPTTISTAIATSTTSAAASIIPINDKSDFEFDITTSSTIINSNNNNIDDDNNNNNNNDMNSRNSKKDT